MSENDSGVGSGKGKPDARRKRLILRPVSLVSWRDALATLAPIVLLSAAAIAAAVYFVRPAPPRTLTIASGPETSNFHRMATRYREILARDGVDLVLVPTRGSAENLEQIAQNQVDIALVQSGVQRADGDTKDLVSLGTMFRQPVYIFYRSATPITRLSELRGQRISVGREGSGTQVLAKALLEGNGIEADSSTLLDLDSEPAKAALLAGSVDAIFLSGDSARFRMIRELLHVDGIRLFDFVQGEAYERRFRYLNRLHLPAGAFDLGENLPAQPITLMAPTVELLAHRDIHPALIDLLVGAAQEVHNRGSLIQNPGEFPHAIEHDYPMHPDAARYYKSGRSFIYRYLPFWLASLLNRIVLILAPVLLILLPGLRFAPNLYGWRVSRRIYKRYAELMALERAALGPTTAEQRTALLEKLAEIEKSIISVKVPGAFADQLYVLRRHIQFVRGNLEQNTAQRGSESDDLVAWKH